MTPTDRQRSDGEIWVAHQQLSTKDHGDADSGPLMEHQRPDRQISDGPPATAAVGPLALPTVALCRAGIGLLSGSRFKKSGLMAKGANEKVV